MKCRQIWWFTEADESSKRFISKALIDLQTIVNQRNIADITVVREVPTESKAEVKSRIHILHCLENWVLSQLRIEVKPLPIIVVYCPGNDLVKKALLDSIPGAVWGGALGTVAWVVKPKCRHTVWHEALHLLGADDCYKLPDDEGPNCGCPNCLMQYIPRKSDLDNWPFLCQQNVDQIRA